MERGTNGYLHKLVVDVVLHYFSFMEDLVINVLYCSWIDLGHRYCYRRTVYAYLGHVG